MGKLRSTTEIVVWDEVREVLARKIEDALSAVCDAPDARTMGEAQGRLKAYREMVNLPRAMLVSEGLHEADEHDREAIQLSQDPRNWKHPDLIGR